MNLDKAKYTSDICMCILGYIFQSWQNSSDYIVGLEVRYDLGEFAISNASDLRFDIIQIFSVIGQKRFELFFTHSFS